MLLKKAEPRHSDDETSVKLGRTRVILSTPTINHFLKKLGTSSKHKVSPPPLNCQDMPGWKNRAKGNRAIVSRFVDRSHGTLKMLNERSD